jgi:hypothetical protein
MRSIGGGLLLLCLVSAASAQTGTAPQADSIDLADLEGVTLHLAWTFTSRFRNDRGEFSGGRATQLQVKLGAGGAIQGVSRETGWADTPGGRKSNTMTRGFVGTIGVPGKNKDGSATMVWLYEDNTLTRLGVVEIGGATLKINLARTASGLSCSAAIGLAREVGAGNRIDRSTGGGKVETLSARLVGTPTCRVVDKRGS